MGQSKTSGNDEFENEIPLKNMARIEEGQEQQRQPDEPDGVALDNRRQKRKFNAKKLLIFLVAALLILAVIVLIVYFVLQYFATDDKSSALKKAGGLVPPNVEVPLPLSASILHAFKGGAVCSDSEICSNIGRDIFHRGGNAVDAALATLFCNGIATMQSMGIGGGFIMNVYIKRENKAYTIDAREVAPLTSSENMFADKHKNASVVGPLSIGVPGEVMGYLEAYKRFGSMTWKEIIEPSIKICHDGIILTKHMHDALQTNKIIKDDHHLRTMFVNSTTGEFNQAGSRVYPPKELCETYKLLMTNGPMDFYNGTLARMITDDLKEIGSIITIDDLEGYNVHWHYSIPIHLNDDILYVVPPVGSGTILAFILNILKGFKITSESISTPEATALTYHRFIEAFKFAFGKRSQLGDSRFNDVTQLIANLTSPEYAETIRLKIDDSKTFDDAKHYDGQFYPKTQKGTSHLSILAPNGDAVSVTTTVNFYFGSGHTGRRTGIIFNSGMDDFSTPGNDNAFGLPAAKPNFIRPQKRALSSMTPTIVTDTSGEVKLVIGAAGGSKITTSIALIIARILWMGQNIKEAIDAPRVHHQLAPNEVQYEYGVLQSVIDKLEGKGHKTHRYLDRGSVICGIYRNATAVYANADYRKKGEVVGL